MEFVYLPRWIVDVYGEFSRQIYKKSPTASDMGIMEFFGLRGLLVAFAPLGAAALRWDHAYLTARKGTRGQGSCTEVECLGTSIFIDSSICVLAFLEKSHETEKNMGNIMGWYLYPHLMGNLTGTACIWGEYLEDDIIPIGFIGFMGLGMIFTYLHSTAIYLWDS